MDKSKTFLVKSRPLPLALMESDCYASLNDKQKFNYHARLKYIEEISLKIDEYITEMQDPIRVFLDRIELDLYINVGMLPSNPKENASSWLLHSDWAYSVNLKDILSEDAANITNKLNSITLSANADFSKFVSWLREMNNLLTSNIDSFYVSKSFESAMILQIVIDMIVCDLLKGVISVRLNPTLAELMAL